MSGELGFYNVVVGNMGDRNDLDLWYKGGSLVSDFVSSSASESECSFSMKSRSKE